MPIEVTIPLIDQNSINAYWNAQRYKTAYERESDGIEGFDTEVIQARLLGLKNSIEDSKQRIQACKDELKRRKNANRTDRVQF